ncbi:MAG: oligosaccharide flippase family protein, partial [Phycisphaerae bacterium]|nr:oligosaccharide flippase family protein [Phycisphaerae bacterium]
MTNVIRHFTEKLRGPGVGPVLVKGGGGALIVKVVGAGAAFVAYILLARLLGLQSFGDYVYVVGWASVLMTFGKLGFDSATIRHVAQYRAAGDEPRLQGFLRRSWQLPLAMATIVAAGFAAATWVIREQLRPELTWAMYTGAGLIVVWTALQIAASRLQAIKRVVQATVPNLVLRPLLIVVGVAILWGLVDDDIHPAAGVGVNALATFALAVLSLRWFTRSGTRPGPGVESTYETGAWLKVALPLLLIATMSRLLTRVDLLMVGSIRGTDKAAIYGAASETANLVAFGLVALIAMARPMVAELYAAGDRKRLRRTARLVALGATGIALPAFVILLVLGPWILDLFGASFSL